MKYNHIILYLSIIVFQMSCKQTSKEMPVTSQQVKEDLLPSFNEGNAKTNIINFVESVSDTASTRYVKPEDRIVCFDNDGTLWVEQPLPSQIFFAFDRIKSLAKDHPEWNNDSTFKAIIENDTAAVAKFHTADVVKMVGTAHALDNVTEFDSIVNTWLETHVHPVLNKSYTQLVYQPMLELMSYLRHKEFKIYIVSGGSQEFMRAWAKEVYGIPEENIIGSTFKRETVQNDNKVTVAQTTDLDFNDDHEGKVLAINKFIGKKPIMVVGNSDGDLEMMQYCDTDNPLPHFLLYLKHTDDTREFLYDENTLAGKLIKGETVAKERNWTIIDMKKDWNAVFPKTE